MRPGRDVWFDDLIAGADPVCPAEPMEAEHPLFLLYSSGSTAKPKGILHTTGGYLTGVTTTMAMVFDLDAERDIFWCTADVGWITGHSYIVYGPLANGCTSVMFEGAPDYPDKDIWWEIVERYGVTIFYTAPTAIRACMKWGEEYPGKHNLSSLRLLGTVGEPINPKAWLWYHAVVGGERCPIVDTWWQTETGAIMISTVPGVTPAKPGSAGLPLPGVSAALLDETGAEIEQGSGLLALTKPWPSMLRTLYNDPDRYVQTYFARFGTGIYFAGEIDAGAEPGEVGLHVAVGVVVQGAEHARPRLGQREQAAALLDLGAGFVQQGGRHPGQRQPRRSRLGRGDAWQRRDHDGAGFRLPPRVDDGAALAADDRVIPQPCLGVDRLADRPQQPQRRQAVPGRVSLSPFHARPDGGRRGVEDRDAVPLDDLPPDVLVRVVRGAFEHHRRASVGQRTVHDVRMAGDPAHVGRAPEDVAFDIKVEDHGHGRRDPGEVSAGGVQDPLRLRGGAGGVEQ